MIDDIIQIYCDLACTAWILIQGTCISWVASWGLAFSWSTWSSGRPTQCTQVSLESTKSGQNCRIKGSNWTWSGQRQASWLRDHPWWACGCSGKSWGWQSHLRIQPHLEQAIVSKELYYYVCKIRPDSWKNTSFLPHFMTPAARRFCSLRELITAIDDFCETHVSKCQACQHSKWHLSDTRFTHKFVE